MQVSCFNSCLSPPSSLQLKNFNFKTRKTAKKFQKLTIIFVQPTGLSRIKSRIKEQKPPPPPHLDGTHFEMVRGFRPSVSTSRARRSHTATSNKDNQICFMLIPRTSFKDEEFRLEQPPYPQYLFITCRHYIRADLYPQYISSFCGANCILSCRLEFLSLEVQYDIFRYGDEGTWQKARN